jgi:4,4'-diaponeurosporenoate glycosyltransferase
MIALLTAFVLGMLGFAVLWRIPGCDGAEDGPADDLSIIIPARNEAHNLPVLLRSLSVQRSRPREVIVVDDGSTDGTAEVAEAHGARVVTSLPLPPGWGGKTWACQQGAEAATGRRLLFVDADTWFEERGLGRILGTHAARGGVLSVGPWHVVRKPHEQLSAFFNLIMTAGIGCFTILGHRIPPRGLFGQMLLVARDDYFAAGGHASVKGRNLENFCLAEHFRARGIPLHCAGGRGVFSFRMYPHSLSEVVAGWTKGFAAGAGQTPLPLLLLIIGWIAGLFMPLIHLPLALAEGEHLLATAWLLLYAAMTVQIFVQLRRVGSFHGSTALLYPICLIFYFVVFTRSLLRNRFGKRATWKGRTFEAG